MHDYISINETSLPEQKLSDLEQYKEYNAQKTAQGYRMEKYAKELFSLGNAFPYIFTNKTGKILTKCHPDAETTFAFEKLRIVYL